MSNLHQLCTLCNFFTDLMRTPPFDHVQPRPSVLGLGSGRSSYEKRVLELSLQTILLHIIGQGCWDLPVARSVSLELLEPATRCSLRVSHAGEARPADIGAMGE